QSTSIIEDLDYQLSNLQVDKEYVNRLATEIDDGGTIEAFNEQFDLLIDAVNGSSGLIALQRQKLSEVNKAAQAQEQAKQA
ncbi:methyl-accepting chemotaxis protein, partial [Alteromonas sp. ALT199]|nr:methyl-accepting chemotaxis protein [Alteromonas sp. ALT199]